MKRMLYLLFALSFGLNAGLLYVQFAGHEKAEGREHRDRDHRDPRDTDELIERRVRRMTRDLGLDAAQQEAMTAALRETLPEVFAQTQALRTKHLDLAAEFSKATMDPERIRALVRDLTQIQGELDAKASEAMIKEASLLSPEQRVRFAETLPWRFSPRRSPKRKTK
ncbi:Spy/CpxP family protein refolding chaperone [Acidobacteriota bacterium]